MKLTVSQLVEKRPYLSAATVRWLLFKRATNGLNMAVFKIGKKILIDEEAFDTWIEQHREGVAHMGNN